MNGGRALAAALLLLTADAGAQHDARVGFGSFSLDRTEVTIAQFRAYAAPRGIVTAAERAGGGFEWDGGWVRRPGWTVYRPDGVAPASPDLPAVHLSWSEAAEYCRAMGGRLPTAAEWQRAAYAEARAVPPPPFVAGQVYPFPTGATPAGANTSAPDRWPRSAPAGETAAGVNGLHDMGGNVWEWVADAGPGGERRTMGGSWWYGAEQMRADVQAFKPAEFYAVYVGFRCAYDTAS